MKYIKDLNDAFSDYKVRVNVSNETFNKKIKRAEVSGYHYIIVVGDREIKEKNVSYRNNGTQRLGVSLNNMLTIISKELVLINVSKSEKDIKND